MLGCTTSKWHSEMMQNHIIWCILFNMIAALASASTKQPAENQASVVLCCHAFRWIRYAGQDKVPEAWCESIKGDLAVTGIYDETRAHDAAMYSTACLEIKCIKMRGHIYGSLEHGRNYSATPYHNGYISLNHGLCTNMPGSTRLAVTLWGVFAACLVTIVIIGLAQKCMSSCWPDIRSICCCAANLPSSSLAKADSSGNTKWLQVLLATWQVVQGKLGGLVLLGGLVFDVVTDILQFITILPNKFAYLLLAAVFLPTVAVGGIWHLTRPRGAVLGQPWHRWLAAMLLILTTPVMAVAWGLWLNAAMVAAVAINLVRRRPAMQRPSWLAVDMHKYAHVFNVFTALLEDPLSAAFTTGAYLAYDKSLLSFITTDETFMLSLLGTLAHMLISAWSFKNVLLSRTRGSFGSMLRSLWQLAPEEQQEVAAERGAPGAGSDKAAVPEGPAAELVTIGCCLGGPSYRQAYAPEGTHHLYVLPRLPPA